MHKDLSDDWRGNMETSASVASQMLKTYGQSLALAREAWINAFDKAAAELDAG